MNRNIYPLHLAPCGKIVKVKELTSTGYSRNKMLDFGLIEGTKVESLRRNPSGDPTAYEIRGAVIALRREEASKIMVEPI